jgi:selenide,water dikinase
MADQGVSLQTGTGVAEVSATGVRLVDGRTTDAAFVVGAAGAVAQAWVRQTDLPTTDGFIDITPNLTVTDDPTLFAVGDCAHMADAPRPKAGVFAVRAAPVLLDNLRATLTGRPLRPFRPQRDYLKLISLGEKSAMAEKFGRTISGPWLWRLKDRIDRKFMDKFAPLPVMTPPAVPRELAQGAAQMLADKPLCGGCGAKVGGDVLRVALADLPATDRPDILSGPGDDAAVISVGGAIQVQTTDHLRAFTEDPALLARIAAVHALGDVWAMGAAPQTALATVILPRMAEPLQARTMAEITAAASDVFTQAGAALVGGHSTMGAELTIGFTVTGLCDGRAITLGGGRPGDALILTRPLGTGVILAAEMAGAAAGADVAAVLDRMARPQGPAAALLTGAHAMTDVTGFGLAGHLQEICRASGCGAQIDLAAIPLYPGALALAEAGHRSSLMPSNAAAAPVAGAQGVRATLLHDPQTAGGLLAAVAPDGAQDLVRALSDLGEQAAIIGYLCDGPPMVRLAPPR